MRALPPRLPADVVRSDAPAPAPAPRPAPTMTLNPAAQTELTAMMAPGGRPVDIWTHDGKARKARVSVSSNKQMVGVVFEDGKKEQAQFAVKDVRGVLLNAPKGTGKKGGLFGGSARAPVPGRSIVLEDETGNTIFHFELGEGSEATRNALGGAIAAIAGVPARA